MYICPDHGTKHTQQQIPTNTQRTEAITSLPVGLSGILRYACIYYCCFFNFNFIGLQGESTYYHVRRMGNCQYFVDNTFAVVPLFDSLVWMERFQSALFELYSNRWCEKRRARSLYCGGCC